MTVSILNQKTYKLIARKNIKVVILKPKFLYRFQGPIRMGVKENQTII